MAGTADPGGLRVSWLHDAGFVGEDDCVYPVGEVEFHEHPGDMGLDRRVADHEGFGDLAVGQASCQEGQDFAFTGGEVIDAGGGLEGPARAAGELLDDRARDGRRQQRVPPTMIRTAAAS